MPTEQHLQRTARECLASGRLPRIRSESIWGGSAEIQRNIVGERVLGLLKEPKPA